MFVLFNFLIALILAAIDRAIDLEIGLGVGVLGGLYSLFVLVPSLAVLFRRLHDTGHSGWAILYIFIPLAGPIILLVFLCQDSYPAENKYGPNPKEIAAAPTYTE
jgi:uncharacterized membrane protein YhaH (DUF805 family)